MATNPAFYGTYISFHPFVVAMDTAAVVVVGDGTTVWWGMFTYVVLDILSKLKIAVIVTPA